MQKRWKVESVRQSKVTDHVVVMPVKQLNAIVNYDVRRAIPAVLTPSTPVLIIHGTEDKAVFYSERAYLLRALPHGEIAQTPRTDFGHQWFDYFNIDLWCKILNEFLDRPNQLPSRL